ncbi:hypothetical protein ACLOJK_007875 [Asimina triloba]
MSRPGCPHLLSQPLLASPHPPPLLLPPASRLRRDLSSLHAGRLQPRRFFSLSRSQLPCTVCPCSRRPSSPFRLHPCNPAPLLPSEVVSSFISPAPLPALPFRLPSLLPSSFLPPRLSPPFRLPAISRLPPPFPLPSPAVSHLPSLSASAPHASDSASASASVSHIRLPCRPSGSDFSGSAQRPPRSASPLPRSASPLPRSASPCCRDLLHPTTEIDRSDVSDVYVDLVGMNAEEDNENGQNLGGEDLGGVNENAQNFVEKNVDQNVTAINVDDDNSTPNASQPTNSKSDKPHGNTTSAVWQHFTKKETKNKNEPVATCNYCRRPFKCPKMIIVDEEPFKIVEHEGLRRWYSMVVLSACKKLNAFKKAWRGDEALFGFSRVEPWQFNSLKCKSVGLPPLVLSPFALISCGGGAIMSSRGSTHGGHGEWVKHGGVSEDIQLRKNHDSC